MVNIGSTDRIVRIIAGLVLIALCLLPPSQPVLGGLGAWLWVVMAAGAVLVVTGLIRFCPAYLLLGINTATRR